MFILYVSSDKDQLLEIAKANAAAMCAKAGMPIPASLRSTVLPLALPSMAMNAAMASMTAGMILTFVYFLHDICQWVSEWVIKLQDWSAERCSFKMNRRER